MTFPACTIWLLADRLSLRCVSSRGDYAQRDRIQATAAVTLYEACGFTLAATNFDDRRDWTPG